MEDELEGLLANFPNLELNMRTKRVRCVVSGHEMPCKVDVIKSYVGGKKFEKAKEQHQINLKEYEPFIVPSVFRKKQLFCRLTGKYINYIGSHIERHVSGVKYKRAKGQYKAGSVQLMNEEGKDRGEKEEEEEGEEEKGEDVMADRKFSDMELEIMKEFNDASPTHDTFMKPIIGKKHKYENERSQPVCHYSEGNDVGHDDALSSAASKRKKLLIDRKRRLSGQMKH